MNSAVTALFTKLLASGFPSFAWYISCIMEKCHWAMNMMNFSRQPDRSLLGFVNIAGSPIIWPKFPPKKLHENMKMKEIGPRW